MVADSQDCIGMKVALLSCMIVRETRKSTKRSARRIVSGRANNFRNSSEGQTHAAFALPDSYQAWVADSGSREIDSFYRA
jgi:hypothetical protein